MRLIFAHLLVILDLRSKAHYFGQNSVPLIANPRLPKDAQKSGASFIFPLIFGISELAIPIMHRFLCKIGSEIVLIQPLSHSAISAEISTMLLISIYNNSMNGGGSQGKNRFTVGLKLTTLMA